MIERWKIYFDCTHCKKPRTARDKKELLEIIAEELGKENFVNFDCTRGSGEYGCTHRFDTKVIIIKPFILPGENTND